jgi:PPOX class probable FMN-dependent enzyme
MPNVATAIIDISRAGATRLSGAGHGNCRCRLDAISDAGNREAIMSVIATIEQLEAIYGHANDASTVKVADRVTPAYRVLIEKSPFAALATCGPEGLDCSPRGDLPGFVRIRDEKTLMMPDRRGNNRVDSLRNIVRDPRIALLFLIPGSGSTLRVNGRALVSTDPDLLASFKVDGKAPRTVVVMTVDEIYFQCARAIVRSDLWNPDKRVDPKTLPTPGQILAEMSENKVGGEQYDREWPERARQTMW